MIAKMMVTKSCLSEKILIDASVVVIKLKRHSEGYIDKHFHIFTLPDLFNSTLSLNRIYRGGSRELQNIRFSLCEVLMFI